MKICRVCNENKSSSEFHKDKKKLDGLDARCKSCRKTQAAKDRANNYLSHYLRGKRSECKIKELEFDLDVEYLASIWTGTCAIFNTEIHFSGITSHTNQASLDRKDPSMGYVKGNVQWVSSRANRIKYNATIEELELILKNMKQKV